MSESRTKNITEWTYSQLKKMILYHKLTPGQRLQDRDLAKQLNVSRTPVREALSRLERDGLVVNQDGKGHFVQRINPKEVEHLYELRELLETYATALAVKNATPQDVEELVNMHGTLERLGESLEGRAEGIRLGIQFHARIARASGNPFLYEMLVRLLDQQLFYIWTEGWLETPAERGATRREHRAYMAALQGRSLPKARQAVRTHVRRFRRRLLEILKAREAFYEGIEGGSASHPRKQVGSSRMRPEPLHGRSRTHPGIPRGDS